LPCTRIILQIRANVGRGEMSITFDTHDRLVVVHGKHESHAVGLQLNDCSGVRMRCCARHGSGSSSCWALHAKTVGLISVYHATPHAGAPGLMSSFSGWFACHRALNTATVLLIILVFALGTGQCNRANLMELVDLTPSRCQLSGAGNAVLRPQPGSAP
jgi:hypothetical protein